MKIKQKKDLFVPHRAHGIAHEGFRQNFGGNLHVKTG